MILLIDKPKGWTSFDVVAKVRGILFLGETRDTDDIEGKITSKNEQIIPTLNQVNSALVTFIGEFEQIPPLFSAIKMKGKKAYELARKGKEVIMSPRKVNIYSIKLVNYEYPTLKITCEVSSGTYIRSLARDIGKKLSTGAYLNELRRTKVGQYTVQKAVTLQELQQKLK
jgi:tRNA pseudouridine55 synthase